MTDSRCVDRRKRRLSELAAMVGVAGGGGVFLHGLVVGQRLEASDIEGVGRLWWFSVVPVVLGIVLATAVTTRRAMRHHRRTGKPADDFERSKAATLKRLSVLVESVSSEGRPGRSESWAGTAGSEHPPRDRSNSSHDPRELELSARH